MKPTIKRNGEVFYGGVLIGHVYKCDGLWVRSYYKGAQQVCLGGLVRTRSLAVGDVVACYRWYASNTPA